MATKNTKITVGNIVSSTRKYSNVDDAERVFNIHAEVNIKEGKTVGFNLGTLNRKNSDTYGNATFNCGQDVNHFSFNSNGLSKEEIKEAVNAIVDFINEVDKNVEELNEE